MIAHGSCGHIAAVEQQHAIGAQLCCLSAGTCCCAHRIGYSRCSCRISDGPTGLIDCPCVLPVAEKAMLQGLYCTQSDFGSLLMDSHSFYRTQWVGHLPRDFPIKWRHDAFVQEVGPTRLNWGDLTGGLMEGREAGKCYWPLWQ